MLKGTRRSRLYFRYLFSYLALALIPTIVIGVFYSTSFSRAFSNEVFTNVDKDLANISTQVDSQLDVFDGIVRQLSVAPQLRNMPDRFDPESINELKQLLANYKGTNTFVQNIFLTLPQLDYVVSTTSSSQLDYFTGSLFTRDGTSPQAMHEFFTSSTPRILSSARLQQPGVDPLGGTLFCYPLFTDYLKQVGTLVFLVPDSSLKRMISDKLAQYKAETILLGPDLALMASVGAQAEPLRLLNSLTAEQGLATTLHRLEEKYVTRSYTSPKSGYCYVTLIPRNQQAFTQIAHLNSLFLLSLLVVTLLSGVAIAYALRLNYFPLHRLHDKAEGLMGKQASGNELDNIADVLEELSGRNLYLAAKLENNAASIKINRLQKLLTNGYASVADFNLDCQELNLSLCSNSLFVTISYIHADGLDLDELGLMLKQLLADRLESHYLYGMETGKLVMLHCIPPQTALVREQQLIDIFVTLHQALLSQRHLLLTTGIGSIVSGTTELSRSYLDASTALDYRFIKGKGQVIGSAEISTISGGIIYPQQHFDKLKNALRAGNEPTINTSINEIITIVEQNNYPLSMARGICFNLINTATNTLPDDIVVRPAMQPNLFALAEVETIQELVAILKDWRSELRSRLVQAQPPGESLTIDQVMTYLRQSCLHCDFSIYETAEHFGMQLPKFSQYFKEQTSQNVLDYTIQLRMDEAARLLEQTEDEIKDIALKTGYYNTSSFIRRFKQIHGVTPGDYRKFIRTKKERR